MSHSAQDRYRRLIGGCIATLVTSLLALAANGWMVTPARAEPRAQAPTPDPAAWRGEYYANQTLTDAPAMVRTDPSLDFDWEYGAPAAELPVDEFSVRWTSRRSFEGGVYRFHVEADDGIRLYVDGAMVIDEWQDGARRERTSERQLTAGSHDLRVEYYERRGVAVARVWWEKAASYPHWKGEYWSNRAFTGLAALVRNDPDLKFEWGYGSPAAGLPADEFSVRWTRRVAFAAGFYRFHATMDDGIRVYVDGQLIIDDWRDGGARERTADRTLSAGNHDLRVEYYEKDGVALANVWWERVASYPEWKGEYWANRTMDGNPTVVRSDRVIDFDWGYGAPAAELSADDFSARWTRQLSFEEGTYRFHTEADDAIRLYVDDQLVLSDWRDAARRELTVDRQLSAGYHNLRVEYYEHGGEALAKVWWEKATAFLDWKGEFWANRSLSGSPALVRADRFLDFDWGYFSPAVEIPDDNFSARWTRQLTFDEGVYRFRAVLDDAVRLYVDDELVLDNWEDGARRELSVDHSMSSGNHDLRVEYYEHGGEAQVSLWWERLPSYPAWQGEYWSNGNMYGYPTMVRSDPTISFDWGMRGPGGGVSDDRFSARWTRQVYFSAATHRFHALVDDGMRLWVDDQRVIDAWYNHSLHEVTGEYSLARGIHTVKVEYFDNLFDARISVWWEEVAHPSYPEWKGRYWDNRYLSGDPVLVRNDPDLDFDWDKGAPAEGLPDDDFSARWTQDVGFDPGVYRFYLRADDGVRLYIDGKRVLDEWHDSRSQTYQVDARLSGEHELKVEFFEHLGDARLLLWWKWVDD